MRFDYQIFINELKYNDTKKEVYEKYFGYYPECINMDIDKQPWYLEYVNLFSFRNPVDLLLPEKLKSDFDWILLQKLVASSFSSHGYYSQVDKLHFELEIKVETGGQYVTKKLSNLWEFQVFRLYEIYIEEHMNLQILIHEDVNEKEAILKQREQLLTSWQYMFHRDELLLKLGLFDVG